MLLKKALDIHTLETLRVQLKDSYPRLSDEPVCDFCGDEKPVVVYASMLMSTGENRACWRWCACSTCEDIITKARWYTLRDRVVERLKTMLPGGTPHFALIRTVERVLLEFHITVINVPEDLDLL